MDEDLLDEDVHDDDLLEDDEHDTGLRVCSVSSFVRT